MDHPGLIKREITPYDKDHVMVREEWDPRVPGCPMIVVDPIDLKSRPDARLVVRYYTQRR